MALVAINNLQFQYAGSNNPTLIDITTSIREQEFILLLGPTGCGKTSLCRCINGLIPHFYQGKYSGNVIVNGKETFTSEVYDLATSAGLVFQNPDNQLVSLNVERELAFAPENLGLPREEIHSRVEEIIELLSDTKLEKLEKLKNNYIMAINVLKEILTEEEKKERKEFSERMVNVFNEILKRK